MQSGVLKFSPCWDGAHYRLQSSSNSNMGGGEEAPTAPEPRRGEDLPYRVELWNAARDAVEQILAVTANGSIGFAAYYAAAREFPDRYVTLRHKNRIVSSWNDPKT